MRLVFLWISVLSIVQCVLGATVEGFVELPGELTNIDLVHTSIELLEITSDPGKLAVKRHAYINKDGVFKFNSIPKGSFLLSVSHIEFNLVPFKSRVDVSENDEVTIHLVQAAQRWEDLGVEVPHPIRIIPNTKIPERQYIKNRTPGLLESGPIATVVNNPLYLGGAILVLVAAVAPYLLEKFDPETAKIMKEQRAQRSTGSSQAALKAADSINNFDIGEKIGNSRASKAQKK